MPDLVPDVSASAGLCHVAGEDGREGSAGPGRLDSVLSYSHMPPSSGDIFLGNAKNVSGMATPV